MKDFFKTYQKRKITGNIFIVLGAFAMAFGINFFLIDGSDFGKNLKTSVLDIKNIEEKADLILEKNNSKIFLKNTKKIENMINFSISLAYNPENIIISDVKSKLGEISILGDKSEGVINIILNQKSKDIEKNNNILEIITEKKENKSSPINLVNGNFTDSKGEKYEFTTSGIIF